MQTIFYPEFNNVSISITPKELAILLEYAIEGVDTEMNLIKVSDNRFKEHSFNLGALVELEIVNNQTIKETNKRIDETTVFTKFT